MALFRMVPLLDQHPIPDDVCSKIKMMHWWCMTDFRLIMALNHLYPWLPDAMHGPWRRSPKLQVLLFLKGRGNAIPLPRGGSCKHRWGDYVLALMMADQLICSL